MSQKQSFAGAVKTAYNCYAKQSTKVSWPKKLCKIKSKGGVHRKSTADLTTWLEPTKFIRGTYEVIYESNPFGLKPGSKIKVGMDGGKVFTVLSVRPKGLKRWEIKAERKSHSRNR